VDEDSQSRKVTPYFFPPLITIPVAVRVFLMAQEERRFLPSGQDT
jgi:hypothetical protein